ncbi:MAG: polymer-forming cytoskeletal protein [Methanomicrobiales archaeon]|nr:polymer-forming cytoskeletal protein [Methanomicrobiales archaeon]
MKVYQWGDTYLAPRGSYFDGHVKIDGNLIASMDSHFWGRLVVAGRLELGPDSSVAESIIAQSAVIGPRTKVKGPLITLENVTLCDRACVLSVLAGGDVLLRPGVKIAGEVKSDETITVVGKVQTGELLGRNVKIFGN